VARFPACSRDALGLERLFKNIESRDRGATRGGGMKLAKMRIVVVLPAPLGPRNPMISPRLTSKFKSRWQAASVAFCQIFDLNHYAIFP
jgi:hypothetical protein